jgi:methionyl-tRNA formyltransferase
MTATETMSDKKPLFAFFGTPHFAVVVLDALEKHGLLPALVITAPDKPAGRGMELTSAPAKSWALERGIDVATPATLKDEVFLAELGNTEWDVFIVAAYAKLISKNLLDMPRRGVLNVHPSLLPKFRGASPIYSAILADERETGVTIMQMDEQMDHGPIVAQARIEIAPEDWPLKGSVLLELLATEGGNLLAEVMPEWIAGKITPESQDESGVTFTKKFNDQDACIDLSGDPYKNFLIIRTFDSKHFDAPQRAHFFAGDGKRVIVTDAEYKDGVLRILKVIPEGKKEMAYSDYTRSR